MIELVERGIADIWTTSFKLKHSALTRKNTESYRGGLPILCAYSEMELSQESTKLLLQVRILLGVPNIVGFNIDVTIVRKRESTQE